MPAARRAALCNLATLMIAANIVAAATQTGSQDKRGSAVADFKALEATVVANLTDKERERSAAYLNEKIFDAGSATIGGQQIKVHHSYVVAFIDRNPGANWMHPCRYLLIDPADQTVMSVDGMRPPVFGALPSSWRLVARTPGLEDWQLIRIAPGP
jgi:hypothetical protein